MLETNVINLVSYLNRKIKYHNNENDIFVAKLYDKLLENLKRDGIQLFVENTYANLIILIRSKLYDNNKSQDINNQYTEYIKHYISLLLNNQYLFSEEQSHMIDFLRLINNK